jgi:hypothetical protein
MRDRNLDKNINRVEAFLERWKELSKFLERGLGGEGFTAEEEGAFLELKSQIAQEHQVLMTTLGGAGDRDDKPLRLLNIAPSLQGLRELPEGMPKKITTDWHNIYLSLQALLGRLRGRQAQLAGISSFRIGMRKVFSNPLVIVLIAVAAGYGVYGIYRFAEEVIPRIQQLGEKSK